MRRLNKPFLFAVQTFLLAFSLLHLKVNSQSNSPYTPKVVPPSPNAASLGKFGDIPVSPYTGATEISVPVYTIEAKGVSVPVGLSYHTGGIRLAEEAGWVGLGWTLNAGGMISRSVNDKDDFAGGYFKADLNPLVVPEIQGKFLPRTPYPNELYAGIWAYNWVCRYKVYTDVNTYSLYNYWLNYNAAIDNEADSYSFNFLGRSGKFIIGRDRKIILQKQENLKIEFPNDGSSFTITDEQGNKYYFLDKEYSQPTIGGAQQISSWLLSKIMTQQKDSVMFNYDAGSTWTTVQGITHESDRQGAGAQGTSYANDPGQNYLNKNLVNIDYTNAQIQFVFDGNRTDLTGGQKLNSIKIYSKNQSGLQYLKEQQLYYSYFTPGAGVEFLRLRLDSVKEVSGGISMPPYKFDYNMPATLQNLMGKHYSSVDHWGYFNGKSNAVNGDNTHGFLPDYLGIANVGVSGTGPTLLDLPGANKNPDPQFSNAFSLSKVTYPPGGYTQLEYEPNYYDFYKSTSGYEGKDFEYTSWVTKNVQYLISTNGTTSGSVDLSHLLYALPSGIMGTNLTVAVAFRGNTDSMAKYHSGGSGRLYFSFQGNITDVTNTAVICNGGVCSYSYTTAIPTKTTYPWSAYIDPIIQVPGGLQQIVVNFTWKESAVYNSTMVMAGGLRIKSITDYSASSKIAKKRTYDYGYQQDSDHDGINETYSYGREMGYVSYARYEVIDLGPGHWGVGFTRYSGSNSSYTSQSSGNIVGYEQVTEYTIDPETGIDNGKTVYTYNNSSDTTFNYAGFKFPGTQSLANSLNGLPKSKAVFAKSGSGYRCISSTSYYYRPSNRIIYDAMKFQILTAMGGSVGVIACTTGTEQACSCPNNLDSTGRAIMACFYPSLVSEAVLLDSTVDKTFDQNDTTIQLKTLTTNFYDNPVHNQPTRISVLDSKNNKQVRFIRYPQDYIPNGQTLTGNAIIDSLIKKNMVSSTIEKRDSFYYSGSQTGYIKGAQLNAYKVLSSQSVVLDKQYHLDVSAPVTDFQPFSFTNNVTSRDSRYRQMISFDSYDNTNNILQYTQTDQLPIAIVWEYKNLYPVAQVKKATVANVAYCSFEADGKGNWTFTGTATADATSPTGNNCYNLAQASGNITKSGLTAATVYTVSYWRKTSTPLTITGTQGTATQGKTINGWTYFEHNVTGQTTITVSGTNFIDELRLYPFDAQMTTYTFTPQVGMSSACDVGNKITYYFYDALLRLIWIKDQDKNVIKTFKYHYVNQIPNN